MKQRDIEQGFRDLGLANSETRAAIARMVSPKPKADVEIVTAAHTNQKVKEQKDARLE